MKPEKLFEIIGETEADLLEQSEAKKQRKPWMRLGIAAAACVAVCLVTLPFWRDHAIDPQRGYSIETLAAGEIPPTVSVDSIAYAYTPEEIFAMQTDIIRGEILKCENVKIVFDNGATEYRSRVEIKVEKVYRGDEERVSEGDTLTFLLPIGFYFTEISEPEAVTAEISMFSTSVVSEMEPGMHGIFILHPYDNRHYYSDGGIRIPMNEFGTHGMFDGNRFCFLEAKDSVLMDEMWNVSANGAKTLDDLEPYLAQMIGK